MPSITTSTAVEVLLKDQHCYLIRNCLSPTEQTSIYHDIQRRSKNTDNRSKPCMHPTPKTIIFDGNQSTLQFTGGDNVYFDLIVQAANDVLKREPQLSNIFTDAAASCNSTSTDDTTTTLLGVGVIRYQVPNGKFPQHIDHCNDNTWVYLLSLGCSANFTIRNGHTKDERRLFQFHSGDVLVFDPSSDAAIVHGVDGINADYDVSLDGPEDFRQFRFGVQCRVRMNMNMET